MMNGFTQGPNEDFVSPGIIELSSSALNLARAFVETIRGVGGDWVATISWSHAISMKAGPNEPYRDIGACLTLGAFKRHEIPAGFVQASQGIEIAVQIPQAIWEKSTLRLIDLDETLPFKLVLR